MAFPQVIKWVELAVRARIDRMMRTMPVSSSQLFALVLLAEKGAITSAELARMMHLTPQAMTTLLGPLRADGFIVRREDSAHRRRLLLQLTTVGRDVLQAANSLTPAIENELLEGFTAAERMTLKRLLGRIVTRDQ